MFIFFSIKNNIKRVVSFETLEQVKIIIREDLYNHSSSFQYIIDTHSKIIYDQTSDTFFQHKQFPIELSNTGIYNIYDTEFFENFNKPTSFTFNSNF